MFIGEHFHSIDDKGRVSVPSKYRQDLSDGVVITRGLDNCLFAYPRAEWDKIAERLSQLPLSQKKSRAFTRLMLAGAWDAEIDSQGRVMIPEYLRQYAGLKKHITLAGLYNRIEIWDEDNWQAYKHTTEAASEEIAEGMADLGI